MGVAIDLMVPEALSGRPGRRSARLPVHGDRAARRTTGLEATIVDNEPRDLTALDLSDQRRVRVRVAGPAALLVAKVIKIAERRQQPQRHEPKDGLDVLRLLQAVPTEDLAHRLRELADDALAGDVTRQAVEMLRSDGTDPDGQIARLAVRAVGVLEDPATISASVAALVHDLIQELDDRTS